MNNILTHTSDFGEIRTVELEGDIWFVGKDVAESLGYVDQNKAIQMHVDAEDKLNDKTALSLGQRGGWIINESGLYSLVLSSKLPTAKAFKRWVTSEVLPSIRKTGGYINSNATKEQLARFAEKLKEIEERLAEQIREQARPLQLPQGRSQWRDEVNTTIRWIAYETDEAPQNLFTLAYDTLEDRTGTCLRTRLKNKKHRMESMGTAQSRINKINRLDVIDDDPKLIDAFLEVMGDLVAHYGLDENE